MPLYRVHLKILSGYKVFLSIIAIQIFFSKRVSHLQSLRRRHRRSRPSLVGPCRVVDRVSFDDFAVVTSPTVCTSFSSGSGLTQTPTYSSHRSSEHLYM